MITRVSRLFDGTVEDVLQELLQNARRAGAAHVSVDLEEIAGSWYLAVCDDGCGIDDPADLLTLGQTGWGASLARREDPAGMGVFSLAGRSTSITSYSSAARGGWQVEIPHDGWEGGAELTITPHPIALGTIVRVDLCDAWCRCIDGAARRVALYYPLPVTYRGEILPRADFLEGAYRIEHWQGCRIGIFKGVTTDSSELPRVNCHGVTVRSRFPIVSEEKQFGKWTARVDILDAPALQLVLPARKEMVENIAVEALRIAVEKSLFRSIAHEPQHRLSYRSYQRARELGIALKEADPYLEAWIPTVKDNSEQVPGAAIRDARMILMPYFEADIEQGMSRAFRNCGSMDQPMVRADPAFEGYSWYDALPRLASLKFLIGDCGQIYSPDQSLPETVQPSRLERLDMEFAIASSGHPDALTELYLAPVDMLVCNNGSFDLDDALIFVARDATTTPAELTALIISSMFCPSDDSDADSWYTQHADYERRARHLANVLLLTEDEALTARIHDAFVEAVQWLVPPDRTLSLSATRGDVSIAITAAPTVNQDQPTCLSQQG